MCFEGFIAVPGEGGGGTDVPLATSSFITLPYRVELGCSDVGWFFVLTEVFHSKLTGSARISHAYQRRVCIYVRNSSDSAVAVGNSISNLPSFSVTTHPPSSCSDVTFS